jgi:hypothetical protein
MRRMNFIRGTTLSSPCKGEVGAKRRVGVKATSHQTTFSLTLPLSGGGN